MTDQYELEERVKTAQAECERLREENVRLRAMLSIHDPVLEHLSPSAPGSAPTPLHCSSITEASTPEQKIALFEASFAGERTSTPCAGKEKVVRLGIPRLASWTGSPFKQLDRKNERKITA